MHLTIIIIECSSEQHGVWNITWQTTLVGKTATQKCPGGNETKGELMQYSTLQAVHNYTGNITRECVGNNSWAAPNVSQCRNTELMTLQTQARNLLQTFNVTTNFPQLLISITAEIRDMINTTIPILPNDISVIINILETILRYVCLQICLMYQLISCVANCCIAFYL